MNSFASVFLEKIYICNKTFPYQKWILPFRDFLPQKKLAPNIIGKQIFDFLIFESIDIQLINKWQISKTLISESDWKMWKSDILSGYLNF